MGNSFHKISHVTTHYFLPATKALIITISMSQPSSMDIRQHNTRFRNAKTPVWFMFSPNRHATFSCPALSAPHSIASSLTASSGGLRTAKCLPAPPHFDCTKFGKRLLSGRELPFTRVEHRNFGLFRSSWIKPLTYCFVLYKASSLYLHKRLILSNSESKEFQIGFPVFLKQVNLSFFLRRCLVTLLCRGCEAV